MHGMESLANLVSSPCVSACLKEELHNGGVVIRIGYHNCATGCYKPGFARLNDIARDIK